MKKFTVVAPSKDNPHPQGCFTRIKLPESCVLVDKMTIIFAPGAGMHVDFLVTLHGIRYIDNIVSEFTQNIEMADFDDVVRHYGHYRFKADGELHIQNDYEEIIIQTKIHKLETVAPIMPTYISAKYAHRLVANSTFGECSQLNDVYGKLEYIINHTAPIEEI